MPQLWNLDQSGLVLVEATDEEIFEPICRIEDGWIEANVVADEWIPVFEL